MDNQNVNFYISFIIDRLFAANKYFNDQEPWNKKNNQERLHTILYVSLELIRKITILIYPIMPDTALKVMSILDRIGFLDYGQGYYGWMIAVHSAPSIIASLLNIKLIFYARILCLRARNI